MRCASPLAFVVSVVLGAVGGCARTAATTSLSPTLDELPHFRQVERVLPVSVGVEGREPALGGPLVPSFEEPELTPEEIAALGQKAERFDWLEFYVPWPEFPRVWPDTGGAAAGIHGIGGPTIGFADYGRRSAVGSDDLPLQGVHGDRDVRFGNTGHRRVVIGLEPESGVQIGVNPPRRVSWHETHAQP